MLKSSLLGLAALALCVTAARADFSVTLDAGQLKLNALTNLAFDDSLNSPNGALLLLIATGADSVFSDSLEPGQFVSGDDIILGAAGFNHNGGVPGTSVNETLSFFNGIGDSVPAGEHIALRWFSDITLTQYQNGTLTQEGYHFGTFDPNGLAVDDGDAWLTLASGALNLNFLTTDVVPAFPEGQAPSAGYASSTVNAVPEPTTMALGALGLSALCFLRRRRTE